MPLYGRGQSVGPGGARNCKPGCKPHFLAQQSHCRRQPPCQLSTAAVQPVDLLAASSTGKCKADAHLKLRPGCHAGVAIVIAALKDDAFRSSDAEVGWQHLFCLHAARQTPCLAARHQRCEHTQMALLQGHPTAECWQCPTCRPARCRLSPWASGQLPRGLASAGICLQVAACVATSSVMAAGQSSAPILCHQGCLHWRSVSLPMPAHVPGNTLWHEHTGMRFCQLTLPPADSHKSPQPAPALPAAAQGPGPLAAPCGPQ